MTVNCLKPSPSLLSKIGSIIIHVEEGTSSHGHAFDMYAIKSLMDDPDVSEWLSGMRSLALLPVKRNK